MAKPGKIQKSEFVDADAEDELDISEEDYGFLIDKQGNLKTMFLPDEAQKEFPASVKRILKIFKITDVDQLEATTLH